MARNFGVSCGKQVVNELNGGVRGRHFGGVNGAGDQHHRLAFRISPAASSGVVLPWIGEPGLDVPVMIQVLQRCRRADGGGDERPALRGFA